MPTYVEENYVANNQMFEGVDEIRVRSPKQLTWSNCFREQLRFERPFESYLERCKERVQELCYKIMIRRVPSIY